MSKPKWVGIEILPCGKAICYMPQSYLMETSTDDEKKRVEYFRKLTKEINSGDRNYLVNPSDYKETI